MKKAFRSLLLAYPLLLISFFLHAQSRNEKLQYLIDSLRQAGNYPGLSVAIELDHNSLAFVSGYNVVESQLPLAPSDRFLTGSVGKTYAAAIAMQLIAENKLVLDQKVSHYLGHYPWYSQIPNAHDITVRMLMNHTSGIMRYEFKESFTSDLTANPEKFWKPEELLQYVFNEPPPFKAGEGWEYSDTNYILLGMIIEKITGKPYYTVLDQKIIKPFKLNNTFPSAQRKLKGLVQGYAGKDNSFGRSEKMLSEKGVFIINPQFEWTGGGIYSTASDLAHWGKILYEGNAFDSTFFEEMVTGVPAKLGKDVKYGLGVIVRNSSLGTTYGHSGFFPGYLAELIYFPEHHISIAVLTNTSDVKTLKIGLNKMANIIAQFMVSGKP